MHYLDDKSQMTLLLYEHPFEFVLLSSLLFNGGAGVLNPVPIARTLASSSAFVIHALKRLEAAGIIEVVNRTKHQYRIANWEGSRFSAAFSGESEAPQSAYLPLECANPEPTDEAFDIVKLYHSKAKPGGPFKEAADRVQELLANEWTAEDLRRTVVAYAKAQPFEYRRNAFNFFETYAGGREYWGAQWLPQKVQDAPKPAENEVTQMMELMRNKREATA